MSARARLFVVVLIAAAAAGGCGGSPADPTGPTAVDLIPPVSAYPGWIIADGPTEYSPDTLYEYLNGGAERYTSHGFRGLVHIRYQSGDDPLSCVTLDVYEMGSELGAFGIYSAARPAGIEPRPWGAEGYRVGAIAAAYRGPVFIHGEADDDRPELLTMLENLVSGVANRAVGPTAPPAILDSLPPDHRVAGSERYVPHDLLGHAFLPGGVLASYEIDGRRAELFVSELGSPNEAADALEAFRTHFDERNVLVEETPPIGEDGFRTNDPISGPGTVVRVANRIAGIQGDLTIHEGVDILRRLLATHTENG
jgi:hypothetical protein